MPLVRTQLTVHLPAADVRQQDVENHCGEMLTAQRLQPCSPVLQIRLVKPWFCPTSATTEAKSASSSTISNPGPRAVAAGEAAWVAAGASETTGNTTVKVAPCPSSLLTITPPNTSTSCRDRQPQAGAAVMPTDRSIDLLEGLENALLLILGDPDAAVADLQLQHLPPVLIGGQKTGRQLDWPFR